MTGVQRKVFSLMLMLVLVQGLPAWAQDKKPSDIPDAPSAAQPPQSFPQDAPPAPKEQPSDAKPKETTPGVVQPPLPFPGDEPSAAAKTMPPTSAKGDGSNSRDDLFKFSITTNFVQVPVTVKDQDGRLVNGLLPKDFQLLENGQEQKMTFFTSDPFPLSAAVIFDLGMPDSVVQKVNRTFPALEGAFSQFDEVSLYTYSSTVSKAKDFAAAGQSLTAVLNELKTKRGRNSGPPVLGGPLGPQGPVVNGRPLDPSS